MKPVTRITLLTNPDVCNLHCPLCFLHQRGLKFGKGIMPFEIAKEVILKYAKTLREVIPSTMGEPLLYKHFKELLTLCESLNIPLNVTTNGTFAAVDSTVCNEAPACCCEEQSNEAIHNIDLRRLLKASSDIKISCMGFSEKTFSETMPGIAFETWKGNVLKALQAREQLLKNGEHSATITLQVTLHKKNVHEASSILKFAESVGVARIKWNPAVFLNNAPQALKERYQLDNTEIEFLREQLKSNKLRSEGILFATQASTCTRFENELWVLPDGSTQNCPNPERRFGSAQNPNAACEHCVMRG